MSDQLPTTLIAAVRYFSDLDICDEYMKRIKWPKGKPACPACGSDRIGELKARNKLKCNVKACQKQFSYKVDTIFEDSPLGLDKWFVAVWCIANAVDVPQFKLASVLDVQPKTLRRMLQLIRGVA